jgi:hypothetical protein
MIYHEGRWNNVVVFCRENIKKAKTRDHGEEQAPGDDDSTEQVEVQGYCHREKPHLGRDCAGNRNIMGAQEVRDSRRDTWHSERHRNPKLNTVERSNPSKKKQGAGSRGGAGNVEALGPHGVRQ